MNIHYITNDPNDRIFALAEQQPRIKPYYIGQKRSITLMMKMDADVVVSTLEDLDNYYIKRSYVRKDTEYVFMPHHMTSMHLTPSKQAYDHYDTVLCVGPHQVAELRREEQLYQLPAKNLAECGYDLLDDDVAAMAARRAAGKMTNERPVVIVAPRGRRTTCWIPAPMRCCRSYWGVAGRLSCARTLNTRNVIVLVGWH